MHEHNWDGEVGPACRVDEGIEGLLALLRSGILAATIGREEHDAGLVRAACELEDALEHGAVLLEGAAGDYERPRDALTEARRELILGVQRREPPFARWAADAVDQFAAVLYLDCVPFRGRASTESRINTSAVARAASIGRGRNRNEGRAARDPQR